MTAKITVEVYDMVMSKAVSDKFAYKVLMQLVPQQKEDYKPVETKVE